MTDFRIRVIVDPTPAVVGTRAVRNELKRTKGTADKLQSSLLKTFGGLGLAIGIAGGIKLLADFSQEMSTVAAVTGATQEQFSALSEEAQRLGRTTRFTATQAAEGMGFLARAGFDAEESLSAVEDTLKLAQAGALDLGRAADIASNILTSFRLEIDQTSRVVDVLALSAVSANTTVAQLGDAMKLVAPIAAGVGVGIEEATAAISALSDAGLQGSLAGTGLRRVISELESPAAKTSAILADLGLKTEDVRISQVGLTAALKALSDAGADTGQALELFGDRGGPAFEVLSNAIPKVVRMTGELENAAGTADRIAKVMDDNLNGALLRVVSAFQGLILASGEAGGLTVLRGIAEALAGGLNLLTDTITGVTVVLGILGIALLATKTKFFVNAAAVTVNTIAYIKHTVAATAMTLVLGGVSGVLLGIAAAAKAAATALAASPLFLFAAAATAAFVGITELTKGIREYNAALKTAEEGKFSGLTEVAKAAERVRNAEKSLEKYQERLDSGNISQDQFDKVTRQAKAAIEFYGAEVDRLTGATDRAREAADKQRVAVEALNAAFEQSKSGLEDEARLLGFSNQEREIQASLLKEIQNIQKEGGPSLTNAEQEELEALIRRNQVLSDQADALDGIKGPQEDFIRQLTALQGLLDAGRITTEEFNKAVGSLATDAEGIDLSALDLSGVSADIDLEDTIANLTRLTEEATKAAEAESLRKQIITDIRGPIEELNATQTILNDLLAAGTITQQEFNAANEANLEAIRLLNPEYAAQAALLEELNGPTERLNERQTTLNQLFAQGAISAATFAEQTRLVTEALNPMTEQEQLQAEILAEIQGPMIQYMESLAALDVLLKQNKISQEEYNTAVAGLDTKVKEVDKSISGGFSDGLAKIKDQMTDLASVTSDVMVNAFNSAEDALVEFATTGKFNFKDFAGAIIKDIARVIARLLILQAVQAITGTGGTTGSASGGDFSAGDTMIVGEKGPERVTFGAPGTVTPADQTASALGQQGPGGGGTTVVETTVQAPDVNIINVDSPEAARDAMSGDEGDRLIMNSIRKNKQAVKRDLG